MKLLQLACHCNSCKKSSGTTTSLNFIVPNEQFQTSGNKITPPYTRLGDSGKNVSYNSCANCGGLLYVEAEAMPAIKIVKYGTVDQADVLAENKPAGELYTKVRIPWVRPFEGASQTETA